MHDRIVLAAGLCLLGAAIAVPAGSDAAPRAAVSGQGFTLRSTSVELPYDEQAYPDGPGAEVMNANCASCHSASMVQVQPKLTRDQWAGIVRKMREVYHAPVADEDVPAIIDYLARLSSG
ncbi:MULTISPECIES: cytochrome c [unclassified Sphingomonas]|uniref:cytochrome c n=1 Tax=unclassified Sphingomonas TaxID=196159 RepID=UPI0006F2F4F3|nr:MULTISPECIES: cytochrome c [unclassified Sphingomonas]KQX26016.1 sulfite:cytochrome C oxidoreductase subunit b precursor [Sphingomonas sp. Root1294]KQY69082.1 sulfite:cytochrome C oxidoreductase subunit b precursor [Sphingomonas sp. Root50]KRB89336.1 sulfite:cytochrome C oxidoreductase subunit b precursor [Sphingomonas sp. Root720]